MDWLTVCCGEERTGKTTLGWQSCKQVDPDFTADNVAFTAIEVRGQLKELPKASAIMIDEAQWVLYGRDALSKESKWLNKTLMKIGGRNLFIWVNIPDFFSLDPYVRKFRVASVARTKWRVIPKYIIGDNGKETKTFDMLRGKFEIYDKSKLSQIYKIKETGVEHWGNPTFVDHFDPIDPKDKDFMEYDKRKEEFMKVQDLDDKKKVKELDEPERDLE